MLSFVANQLSSSPRLHLHQGPWRVLASTEWGFPELKRSMSGSSMVDGEVVTSDSFGNRLIRLRLQVYRGGDPDAALAELEKLHRELTRPRNMLKYQPASKPVWFRTFRAVPESLQIYRNGDYFEVSVEIPAEPFAYGERETAINGVSIGMDPASGMYHDITNVKGDVETPLQVIISGVIAPGFTSALAIRRRGTPSQMPFVVQAESMTTGTNTSVQANDPAMSGSGSNYVATSFGTPTNEIRLSMSAFPAAASPDARGFYRVYARVRRTESSGTITMQLNANKPVTVPNSTSIRMIELGEVAVPGGMDPIVAGPSDVELPAQRSSGLQIRAARSSGSSWLHYDCFIFMPADADTDRFALVTWPNVNSGFHVFDGPSGAVYNLHSSSSAVMGYAASFEGLPLMVSPGQTNRLFFIRKVNDLADAVSDSVTVTAHYWPRYLYVPGVES